MRQRFALVCELRGDSGVLDRVIDVTAEKLQLHHGVERKSVRIAEIVVPRMFRLKSRIRDRLPILIGIPILYCGEMTLHSE